MNSRVSVEGVHPVEERVVFYQLVRLRRDCRHGRRGSRGAGRGGRRGRARPSHPAGGRLFHASGGGGVAVGDATQHLDDDGLLGGAERLYRLLMARARQVPPVHLQIQTQSLGQRALTTWPTCTKGGASGTSISIVHWDGDA